MLNSRRSFIRTVAKTAGGIYAIASRPIPTYAGCSSSIAQFDITQSSFAETIPGMKLGDCEMKTMRLQLGSNGEGYFTTQVGTHFTHGKDVWHLRIQILSPSRANASQFISWFDQTFDGPQMSEKDNPLFHDWAIVFKFPSAGLNPPADKSYPSHVRLTHCC